MKSYSLTDFSIEEIKRGRKLLLNLLDSHTQVKLDDYVDEAIKDLYSRPGFTSQDTINVNITVSVSAGIFIAAMRPRRRKNA